MNCGSTAFRAFDLHCPGMAGSSFVHASQPEMTLKTGFSCLPRDPDTVVRNRELKVSGFELNEHSDVPRL
jgi:hypothetical protein